MVTKEFFGHLEDGSPVHLYRITNSQGEYVSLLDFGATIHEIAVRDRYGKLGDVVLGCRPDAIQACAYRGGTIGRFANRITGGAFTIGGHAYQLERNEGPNTRHSAGGNYSKKLFEGEITGNNQVTFRLQDPGWAGYECPAQASFAFSFDDEGLLKLTLEMEAGGGTVFNPTNHAYFNLTGDYSDVRGHKLWLASSLVPTRDSLGVPDGGSKDMGGTAADFTTARTIREAMDSDDGGYFKGDIKSYDEFYLLEGRQWRLAAVLEDPASGRVMETYTDMPSLVIFCPGGRKPEIGKNGVKYEGYSAVCVETGFVPNSPNCPQYLQPIFQAGEKLVATTGYKFFAAP